MNTYLVLQKETKFMPIRQLNDAEYEEYEGAIKCLADFSGELQLFTIVYMNYNAYENILNRYFEDFTNRPSMSISQIESMNLNINRYILNFLSSVRTYLDHHKTNLKKRNEKNSQRVRLFESACKNAYESHFSYRFLYRLRNYTQHFGMPIGKFTLQKSLIPGSNDIHHSFGVEFDRDELLRYDKWGPQLKSEIQTLPPNFEITPHITVMMKCIEKINFTLIKDDLPNLIKSAEYVKQLIAEIKDNSGIPYISRYEKLNGKEVKIHLEHLPFHLVEMIDNIRNENSRFVHYK
ncbi:MAG: hypothetical protein O8C64_03825 [Candidatus Methanoperedens sp.]|nr:hypothetical protein [Candidatus Methanoperedens sp.]MCZ7403654.1 hypothetical protein [Candidatus Methanoperedens sp.]